MSTSGSTGQPISVDRTYRNDLEWMALTLREHEWHNRDFGKRECAIRTHSRDSKLMSDWAEPVTLVSQSAPCLLLPLGWDIGQLASAILEFRPAYLQSFPSILSALIQHWARSGMRADSLEQVRVFGETLDSDARQMAEAYLSVPLVDVYSTQEVGYIAFQCPLSGFYHVNSDFLAVEIVDGNGALCHTGEVGRVVVTELSNFATPLFRYDTGDWAEMGSDCPCGRGTPTIRRILGRRRNLMRLPDGRRCWPRLGLLFRQFSETYPVKQFHVTQTAVDQLHVRIAGVEKPSGAQEKILTDLIFLMTGVRFIVSIEYTAETAERWPTNVGYKSEDYTNLID